MSVRSGEGLRIDAAARIKVTLRTGNRAPDLSAYTVTASAKIGAAAEFSPTVAEVTDGSDAAYYLDFSEAQLTAGDEVIIEFQIAGTPTINPPAKPLRIPLRNEYEDAP